MPRPYPQYAGTRLWRAVEGAVRELEANGDVRITTAPDYVIGYLCLELSARGVVSGAGLEPRPQERSPDRP